MGKHHVLVKVGETPPGIKASIFVEDPLTARQETSGNGLHELLLPGEAYLGAGPVSSRIEIRGGGVDGKPLRPVLVKAAGDGYEVGRGEPGANLAFHRVNCWALLTNALNLLENPKILGRRVPWAFDGGRLVVTPHAGEELNAYYDRSARGLQFFYFDATHGDKQRVFTCVSHDVVTHELGHAVLDGLKPLYWGRPSVEEAGFHEYFGDAVGMTSALSLEPVLREVAATAKRRLDGKNLVAKIGREVGIALYGRRVDYTRNAANSTRMASLRGVWSEHKYSEVLTGTFYDLLQVMYDTELAQVAAGHRGPLPLERRTRILRRAAKRTSRMMLRSIDYCPPCGLEYIDYARAIIRSDEAAHPLDQLGYRHELKKIFRQRGIVGRTDTLAPPIRVLNHDLRPYDVDALSASTKDAYTFLDANRELLRIPRSVNFWVSNVYRTRKISGGGYYPPREVVVEFVWDVELRHPSGDDGRRKMYCGGTMVFEPGGNVLHYVLKGDSKERRARVRKYWDEDDKAKLAADESGAAAAFAGKSGHRRSKVRSCFIEQLHAIRPRGRR